MHMQKRQINVWAMVTARPPLLSNSQFLYHEQCVYCAVNDRGGQEPGTGTGPTVTECQWQGRANSGLTGGGTGVPGRECTHSTRTHQEQQRW